MFSDDESTMAAAATAAAALDAPELTKEQSKVILSIFPQGDDHSDDLKRAFLYSSDFSQNYRIGRLLGSGSSGFVVSARRLEDGRDVSDTKKNMQSGECKNKKKGLECAQRH